MDNVEKKELSKCSRCRCTVLLETYFSKNRKGEWLKTCNECRAKRSVRKKTPEIQEYEKAKYEKNEELRKCIRCNCTTLLETYFSKNRKGEWNKTCDNCRAKRKEWRKTPEMQEYEKAKYEKNKEKIALQGKVYRENNKGFIAARGKLY